MTSLENQNFINPNLVFCIKIDVEPISYIKVLIKRPKKPLNTQNEQVVFSSYLKEIFKAKYIC